MQADAFPHVPSQTMSPNAPNLRADPLAAFLALELKPREMVLAPILPTQGLAMLYYSWRGVGKTQVALSIAYAVASGSRFLKWQALSRCPRAFRLTGGRNRRDSPPPFQGTTERRRTCN